jgi:plasmid stabilization system protein ParE
MKRARFLEPAERELEKAAGYYEDQASGLGSDFLDRVAAALADIAQFPQRWPVVRGAMRRRLIRRFPYALLYDVDGDEVVILAVMHLRRRPEYWSKRVRRP